MAGSEDVGGDVGGDETGDVAGQHWERKAAARLWGAFGAGAEMPFHPDRFDEVLLPHRDYYRKVITQQEQFDTLPGVWKGALNCARRAGVLAAGEAEVDGRSEISVEDFRTALDIMEKFQKRLAARAARNELRILGAVCA